MSVYLVFKLRLSVLCALACKYPCCLGYVDVHGVLGLRLRDSDVGSACKCTGCWVYV